MQRLFALSDKREGNMEIKKEDEIHVVVHHKHHHTFSINCLGSYRFSGAFVVMTQVFDWLINNWPM